MTQQVIATRNQQDVALRSPTAMLAQQFPEDKYNVLSPEVYMDRLPAATRLSVTQVRVNVDRDTFALPGGARLLGKTTLDKIANAAGISWLEERRADDRRDPYMVEMFVRGRITDFDGTVREITGSKMIDLRKDAGNGIPGKDYKEIVTKAAAKKRDPSNQIMESRKFILEIAASKAKNRAISSALAISRSYDRKELAKPFVVPKLVLDTNDTAAREIVLANLAGSIDALYGRREHVVDATFEESPAPSSGASGEVAGEEGGASSEVATATPPPSNGGPPHDPETGEILENLEVGGPAVLMSIRGSWTKARDAGMAPEAFKELCKSATGKQSKEEMTLDNARAVERAVDAFIANADEDVPV